MRRDPGYEAVFLSQKANKNGRQQQADVKNNGDVGRGQGRRKRAQSGCAEADIQALAKLIAAIVAFSFPEDGRSVAHIFIQRKRVFIGLPQDRLKRQNFVRLRFPYWINR